MKPSISRRNFLAGTSLAAGALAGTGSAASSDKPAVLGGPKAHAGPFPEWPIFDQTEERAVLETLRSGKWYRGSGKNVGKFEQAYAQLTGAKRCLATANGT
ncbi:MAG TPA: DegT/DnrJ/EryC1/StrS family aminotransferase, partial [Bryobacteraceae bacterium]